MQIHTLNIPDGLIEWGKRADVAVNFAMPWAHEVESLVALAAERPLRTAETDRLLARLEALVGEAVRAEQFELLLGFDMLTAEWLDMVFCMQAADGWEVTIGRDAEWSYHEIRALLEHPRSREFCEQVKSLVAEAFPQARIGAIIDRQETPDPACTGCGTTEATVMFTFESGNDYCAKCWRDLTSEGPRLDKRGRRV
jgi:hypothetical protein